MRLPILFLLMLTSVISQAEDAPYIAVGSARAKKTAIAYAPTQQVNAPPPGTNASQTIEKTVTSDLTFTDLFRFIPASSFIEKPGAGIQHSQFKLTDWQNIQAEVLVKTSIQFDGKSLALEAYVYEVNSGKQVLAKKYVATQSDAVTLGHSFANDIVEKLTGLPGIFLTKITMSCDRTGKKEIYAMNFDGTDVKQLTHHRSTAISPAWSPDGTRVAYSVYTKHSNNAKNLDLYEFDFTSNVVRLLSNRKGINSGANYSPDGKSVALTMSFLGNPEIFSLDRSNKTVARLTHSLGFDVEPAWSPDGSKLAFASSRSGMPMVFVMDKDGSNTQRLTFAGRYNASPAWSPNGKKITFAGWLDSRFDIFTMNSDGTNIERLSKNQGSNEDPGFSPDGNFIVFSSNRTGQRNIYVMNLDGSYVKRLTYGLGNCTAPKWSPRPSVIF